MVKKVLKGKLGVSGDHITVNKESLSDLITGIGVKYYGKEVKLEIIVTEINS